MSSTLTERIPSLRIVSRITTLFTHDRNLRTFTKNLDELMRQNNTCYLFVVSELNLLDKSGLASVSVAAYSLNEYFYLRPVRKLTQVDIGIATDLNIVFEDPALKSDKVLSNNFQIQKEKILNYIISQERDHDPNLKKFWDTHIKNSTENSTYLSDIYYLRPLLSILFLEWLQKEANKGKNPYDQLRSGAVT